MVMINRGTKEITLKIVYYGPGLCGKTTNLEHVYATANPEKKGKLLTVATETDRTLFFDFLPVELGKIRNMKVRVQLYTVPGQVFYDATRRIVLRGSDGVVFVADSQRAMMDANVESVENLKTNLQLNNLDPETIPIVFQYNKQDLPDLATPEELDASLNWRRAPSFLSVATQGDGVNETLRKIIERVIRRLQEQETAMKSSSKMRSPYEVPEPAPEKPEEPEEPQPLKKVAAPPPPPPPQPPVELEEEPVVEIVEEPEEEPVAEAAEAQVVPVEAGAITPEEELEILDLDQEPSPAPQPRPEVTSSLPSTSVELPTEPELVQAPEFLEVQPDIVEEAGAPSSSPRAEAALDAKAIERLRGELADARRAIQTFTRALAGLSEQAVRLSEKLEALQTLSEECSKKG